MVKRHNIKQTHITIAGIEAIGKGPSAGDCPKKTAGEGTRICTTPLTTGAELCQQHTEAGSKLSSGASGKHMLHRHLDFSALMPVPGSDLQNFKAINLFVRNHYICSNF